MKTVPCYIELTKHEKTKEIPFTYTTASISNGTTKVNFKNKFKNYDKLTQYNFGLYNYSGNDDNCVIDAHFNVKAKSGYPAGYIGISEYNQETGELSIYKSCNPNVRETINIVCYGGIIK